MGTGGNCLRITSIRSHTDLYIFKCETIYLLQSIIKAALLTTLRLFPTQYVAHLLAKLYVQGP